MKVLSKSCFMLCLVIEIFICKFTYMRLKNVLFSGNYPLICNECRPFYMRAHFCSPYLSHITRSTCIVYNFNVEWNLNIFSNFFNVINKRKNQINPVVNVPNILLATFSYGRVLCSIPLFTVWLWNFLLEEYWLKI